jgi:drug/metabolite transporter (DMT)-like permease
MTDASRLWTGSGLALISAAVFALNVACGPLVYADGGNIHALNYIRPPSFFACVAAWLILTSTPMRLPRLQMLGATALGLIMVFEFYVVFTAVQYIPVGLAILVMYTYPIMVALLDGLLGRSRLSPWLLLTLLVIFAGLGLALGTPEAALDWRGVALAVLAACGMCALVTISERTTAGSDNKVVMFFVTAVASIVMLVFYLVGPEPVWPATGAGSAALAVTICAYIIATFFLFVSVDMIGPVRFSAIDNTAPVWATLFGIFLLGERLVPLQWLGIFLVVGGVVAAQFLQSPVRGEAGR